MRFEREGRMMASKVNALQGNAMVLQIALCDIAPLIHRVVVVPSTITLPKLHVTILRAMGWEGGHLHEFVIDGIHYGEPDPHYPEPDLKSEQRIRLNKALAGGKDFGYLYDYGDSWWHAITVLAELPLQGRMSHPQCLDGANACPPENVGGVPGYEHFLAAMADPKHPEHAHLRDWYGSPFDPNAFSLEDAAERLREIRL